MASIQRRKWMYLATSAVVGVAACSWVSSVTVRAGSSAGTIASLRDQLEKGLRIRRPNEFKFVDDVIRLVERGQLPEKIVKSTFQYARRRHRRFPFPYFEKALRLRAKRIGVSIP